MSQNDLGSALASTSRASGSARASSQLKSSQFNDASQQPGSRASGTARASSQFNNASQNDLGSDLEAQPTSQQLASRVSSRRSESRNKASQQSVASRNVSQTNLGPESRNNASKQSVRNTIGGKDSVAVTVLDTDSEEEDSPKFAASE